ncbi:kelch repeat-containing protein [Colletotrichum incanum]|uniref:Kelch repeat-containing protein n=1 Tax=Colletotrichum incanum TaxID=1573173 RepID=A0A167CXS8_COLIC|nr:kelch repeat-containing protein [Colletotrichum incanum]
MEIDDITANSWFNATSVPAALNHPNVAAVNGSFTFWAAWSTSGSPSKPWAARSSMAPTTDTWMSIPSVPAGTERGSAVFGVSGNEIILADGVTFIQLAFNGRQEMVDTVSTYNTKTKTWRSLPALPEGREQAGGMVVANKL